MNMKLIQNALVLLSCLLVLTSVAHAQAPPKHKHKSTTAQIDAAIDADIARIMNARWTKAHTTEEQTQRDKMLCTQYGLQHAAARGAALVAGMVEAITADVLYQCMGDLGYEDKDPVHWKYGDLQM